MSEPSDKSTISSQPTNEQLEELSAQELDGVTGGDGKTQTKSPKVEALKETITFEYGGLQVHYSQQEANGKMKPQVSGGWNRVRNVRDTEDTLIQ